MQRTRTPSYPRSYLQSCMDNVVVVRVFGRTQTPERPATRYADPRIIHKVFSEEPSGRGPRPAMVLGASLGRAPFASPLIGLLFTIRHCPRRVVDHFPWLPPRFGMQASLASVVPRISAVISGHTVAANLILHESLWIRGRKHSVCLELESTAEHVLRQSVIL